MNIAQLSEQLKDVPQNRLVDYARNPNSVVPQFLALAEIQRRQHLQNTPQPPAATVAEDVLSQAAPQQMAPQQMAQQLPENQPGVAQLPTGMPQGMASGGIVAFAGGGMSDGYDNEDEYDLDERQANREESRIRTLIARMRARAGDAVAEVPRTFASAVPTAIAGIPRAVESAASGIKSFASNLPNSYEAEKAKPTSNITSFKSKGSHPYEEKAIAVAKEVGLDPNLMLHALYKETGGHKDPATAMSKAGAYGPMQLMEAAAKEVGVNRKDAYENLLGGARYLKKQVDTFGDNTLALAAYNAGPGRVRQMLKRNQGIESLSPETQGYVKFSQGGIASFAGPYGSLVEDDEPTSTLGSLFSFLKQTPEQAIFAKNYLEDAQRKKAAQEALIDPELDVPFYKAIRPSERKSVDTRRAEILRSLIPQTSAIDPKVKPAMTSDDVMRLANVNAVNHAQKKEGLFTPSDQIAAPAPAPYVPLDSYDIGFGPNKSAPDREIEQAGPSRPSYVEEALARINQDREDLKAQAGQDKYLALLQAGLGMMSGTSPYAMANIGQGGMQGVAAYAGAKKQRALERLALGKEELSVRRLEQLSNSEKAELAATMGLKQDDLQRKINAEVKRTEEKYSDNLEKFVTAISNRAAKNVPLKDMNGLPIEPEERIRLIQMEENRLFEQNKKILEDLAKRAKIQLPDFSAPPPKPTAPVKKEEPGIFSRLFGGNKQSSEAVDTSNKFLQ
jgi:soluble lytic murein transglycosylase-like protein/predicted DNA-binding protein (UPF0251 family)